MSQPIHIPLINPNEDVVRLCEWLKKEGEIVKKGELITVLETSKASYELEAGADGILHIEIQAGEKHKVGTVIGQLCSSTEELESISVAKSTARAANEMLISEKAAALMKQHNIPADHPDLKGKKAIRAAEIQLLIDRNDPELIFINEHQQAVAKTVTISSQIPQAFLLKKIYVSSALANIKTFNPLNAVFSGITELIIMAIASSLDEFPHVFASRISETKYRKANGAHIGITMDSGKGLFMPVIHSAEQLPYKKITEQLMNYRAKSLKRSFTEVDLAGGNFSLSMNGEQGNIFAIPLVFPGQNAMLSIGSTQKEDEKQFIFAGLAYDHRLLNGTDANAFLEFIRKKIENDSNSLLK